MNDAIELNNRVEILMQTERWHDAIKLLKGEMHSVEEYWGSYWNLGWCYYKLERLDDARKHLIRATKLAPENAVCKWALGNVYLDKQQFKKAEELLVEALQIKEFYIARLCLTEAYLEQGKLAEAENIHLEAIKIKPEDRKRLKAYGDFLSDVGREDEAQQIYRKAKKLKGKAE